MLAVKNYKFWFCTGSQDLYGDECLANVAAHSKEIVAKLNESGKLPFEVVWKPPSQMSSSERPSTRPIQMMSAPVLSYGVIHFHLQSHGF